MPLHEPRPDTTIPAPPENHPAPANGAEVENRASEWLTPSQLSASSNADALIPSLDLERLGKLLRGSATLLLFVAGARYMLAVLGTACLSRLLEPSDYGLVGMVATVTAFLQLFSDLGLSWATIQRNVLTKGQVDNLFWINVAAGAALWGCAGLAAPAIALFFGRPELIPITIVSGAGFLLSGIAVQPRAIFRRRMQQRPLAIVDLGSSVVGLLTGVGMAFAGWGYWSLIGQGVLQQFTQLVLSFVFSDYRPALPQRNRGTVNLLQIGGWLALAEIPIFFMRNFDNLLVGKVWGPEQLGYYTRAYFLTIFPTVMMGMIANEIMVPVLSRLLHDRNRMANFYRRAVHLLAFVGFPLSAALAVTAPETIYLIYGPNWLPVIPLLVWLSIGNILQPVYFCYSWLMIGTGKSKQYFCWQVFAAGCTCAAFLAAIGWGPQGVAMAYSAVMTVVIVPGALYSVHRMVGLRLRDTVHPIARVLAATLVTAIVALAAGALVEHLGGSWAWTLAAKAIVGLLSYATLTLVILRCTPWEVNIPNVLWLRRVPNKTLLFAVARRSVSAAALATRPSKQHLDATYRWLCTAQDQSGDDGAAAYYHLITGWSSSYPETTGYIIPTMLACAEVLNEPQGRERAIRMADWEIQVQLPTGAVRGGLMSDKPIPAVFNTGQVILGWNAAYKLTGEPRYAMAVERAVAWLLSIQDADGAWRRGLSPLTTGAAHVYNVRVAWAMAQAGRLLGKPQWIAAARRNAEWALQEQNAAGWFDHNAMDEDLARPLLHTIAYAMEGLLELGLALEEAPLIAAARLAAEGILQSMSATGRLHGRYGPNWEPCAAWRCLTGDAQLAGILLRLHRDAGGPPSYREAAEKIIAELCGLQCMNPRHRELYGAVGGSHPIWGGYMKYSYPNWAAKFHLDALLLLLHGLDPHRI